MIAHTLRFDFKVPHDLQVGCVAQPRTRSVGGKATKKQFRPKLSISVTWKKRNRLSKNPSNVGTNRH